MLKVEKNNENRTGARYDRRIMWILSRYVIRRGTNICPKKSWVLLVCSLTIIKAPVLCRSLKTNRLFPTANKPDPMPQNLAFLFTKITPEQMMYMWNVLTATLCEKTHA